MGAINSEEAKGVDHHKTRKNSSSDSDEIDKEEDHELNSKLGELKLETEMKTKQDYKVQL